MDTSRARRHERKSALDIFTLGVQRTAGTGSMSSRDYLSAINQRRRTPRTLATKGRDRDTFPRHEFIRSHIALI